MIVIIDIFVCPSKKWSTHTFRLPKFLTYLFIYSEQFYYKRIEVIIVVINILVCPSNI